MIKADDLKGKKFGKLTAIEPVEPYLSRRGNKRTQWLCRCECGRKKIVPASYLKRGKATYCGFCDPPEWLGAKNRICRHCEFSDWDEDRKDWNCSKGMDASLIGARCKEYWCGAEDKLTHVKHRQSSCMICGKPVYSNGLDTPIYCYEHRNHVDLDNKILDEAPKELLFTLIAGIFFRARDDYMHNTDNQRSDAEVFLRSNWAQILSMSEFDAAEVVRLMDEELKDGLRED